MHLSQDKQPDQQRIIAWLAEDYRRPLAEVTALYEHERATLALGAHITNFLHIFAIRNVRKILRRRIGDELSSRKPASRLAMA